MLQRTVDVQEDPSDHGRAFMRDQNHGLGFAGEDGGDALNGPAEIGDVVFHLDLQKNRLLARDLRCHQQPQGGGLEADRGREVVFDRNRNPGSLGDDGLDVVQGGHPGLGKDANFPVRFGRREKSVQAHRVQHRRGRDTGRTRRQPQRGAHAHGARGSPAGSPGQQVELESQVPGKGGGGLDNSGLDLDLTLRNVQAVEKAVHLRDSRRDVGHQHGIGPGVHVQASLLTQLVLQALGRLLGGGVVQGPGHGRRRLTLMFQFQQLLLPLLLRPESLLTRNTDQVVLHRPFQGMALEDHLHHPVQGQPLHAQCHASRHVGIDHQIEVAQLRDRAKEIHQGGVDQSHGYRLPQQVGDLRDFLSPPSRCGGRGQDPEQ